MRHAPSAGRESPQEGRSRPQGYIHLRIGFHAYTAILDAQNGRC